MTPRAGAMVVIRHDVDDARVREYLRWHTFEHLPERLALPGFERAERWVRMEGGGPRFLCVIDVASPGDLESREYIERLDAPTDWTRRLMPHYRNVQRVLCETLADFGRGQAPYQLCMHFDLAAHDVAQALRNLDTLMTAPADARDITRIRVGRSLDALSRRPSEEGRLRGADATGSLAYFVCAGIVDVDAASAARDAIRTALMQGACEEALYAFSFAA